MKRLFLLVFVFTLWASVAGAQTHHGVMVVILDWTTSIPTDATWRGWIAQDAAEVDAWMTNENSYGQFVQESAVVGPFAVDEQPIKAAVGMSNAQWAIRGAAMAALKANGVDYSAYGTDQCGKFVFLYPDGTASGAGYGDLCGVFIGGAFNRTYPPGFHLMAHEQGHMWGLPHAHATGCADGSGNGWFCPSGVGTVSEEYGDHYDVLGSVSYGGYNNWVKANFGWLTITDMVDAGDYLLEPVENPTGQRALRFFGGRKRFVPLILEYRQPIGHDARTSSWVNPDNVFNGVIVRALFQNAFGVGGMDTYVLRMNADTPDQYGTYHTFNNAALTVGQTYCDKDARTGIMVVSASPAGAVIRKLKSCNWAGVR